jgi:hypothetical protein
MSQATPNLRKLCSDKANELLLSYRGEYTTAGVMLLVNEAVLEGADLGLELAKGIVNDSALAKAVTA